MSTVVVSGMMAGDPRQGGATWAVLQYVLGLQRLGHRVIAVEPVKPAVLGDPACLRYFDDLVSRFSLAGRAALVAAGTGASHGMSRHEIEMACGGADLLLNISGMLADERLIAAIPVRVYLDLDPGFIQLWHAVSGIDMRLDAHTHFVTVGRNIGGPGCPVPDCGRTWFATLPPVVLEHWPFAASPDNGALTTVGNWRGYGSIEYQGVHYGQKAHSLRRFMALPGRVDIPFRLALSIHPEEKKDLAALAENGWQLLDPDAAAGTPDRYRDFVGASWAEFGIAKSGYVAGRTGWFSDRSACYLASGRPVLAQRTGFEERLPVGAGLFPFDNMEEVVDAVRVLREDYPAHRRMARRIAEEHLDSDLVLARLLQHVGVS